MPLPFTKFVETLSLERGTDSDDRTLLNAAITSCKKDLYHFCRLSGKHMLEVALETALSSIKREQLQEAVDVCQISTGYPHGLFPAAMNISYQIPSVSPLISIFWQVAFCRLFRCSPFSSHWLLSWGGIF